MKINKWLVKTPPKDPIQEGLDQLAGKVDDTMSCPTCSTVKHLQPMIKLLEVLDEKTGKKAVYRHCHNCGTIKVFGPGPFRNVVTPALMQQRLKNEPKKQQQPGQPTAGEWELREDTHEGLSFYEVVVPDPRDQGPDDPNRTIICNLGFVPEALFNGMLITQAKKLLSLAEQMENMIAWLRATHPEVHSEADSEFMAEVATVLAQAKGQPIPT